MNKILNFLKAIFSREKNEKNKAVGSMNQESNFIVGEHNVIVDQSSHTNHIIDQSSHTQNTVYTTEEDSQFKYSPFIHMINSMLKWSPIIFMVISIGSLFITTTMYMLYFLTLIFITAILFWSFKIPNQYRSFWIFRFNCFSLIIGLIFFISYKSIISYFYPLSTTYITFGKEFVICDKPIFLSAENISWGSLLVISTYYIFLISQNTIKQWRVHLYGKKEYPLTLPMMLHMFLSPFLLILLVFLVLFVLLIFNKMI